MVTWYGIHIFCYQLQNWHTVDSHYIFDKSQSGEFGFHPVGNEKPFYLLSIDIYAKMTMIIFNYSS